MRILLPRAIAGSAARWAGGTVLAVALAGTAVAAGPMAASAQVMPAHNSKSAVVVKAANRHHFGKILVTPKGRALYVLPHGSCTGACLSVWPRLVMPRGKTMPKGSKCLGTAKFGAHGRLQVTYHKMRLYTFADDSGTSGGATGPAALRGPKGAKCPP